MFCRTRASVAVSDPALPYNGAGLIITNGTTILCGYEPRKRPPAIYGLGGKRETADISYRHTAFREAIEELFGIYYIPKPLLTKLLTRSPFRIENVDGYIMLYYTFTDLEYFLRVLQKLRSSFYTRMPCTLGSLITERETAIPTEITHLCLLPVVSPFPSISNDLTNDITRMYKCKIMQPE